VTFEEPLPVADAAERLGVSERTVHRLLSQAIKRRQKAGKL
jgi:DNA-directed RNA polymerase specialized sigma24 family protein